jgi:uncharacterized membrane-anchored protein
MLSSKLLSKVPEVTFIFWVIKILSTGMGETTSDYFVNHIDPVIAVLVAGAVLVLSLALQFKMPKYVAWIYWFAVIMVSVFGTMIADVLHIGLGVPYIVSTIFFTSTLACIFTMWYISEKTLSIHSIYTRRRESFYWATILTTFALGTAAGDMTATTMHLGYFSSGILFAAIFAIPAIGFWKFNLNAILAFWFAYIITRPLGASFADWMGVSQARGGLAWGTGPVSLTLLFMISCFVVYITLNHKRDEITKTYDRR